MQTKQKPGHIFIWQRYVGYRRSFWMRRCPMQTFYYHHPSTCHASFFSSAELAIWRRIKNEEDKRERGLSGLKSEPRTLNYQLTIRSWDQYRERKAFHARLETPSAGFGISLALFWLRYIQQMTVLLVQTTVNMLLKSAVAFFFFSPFLFGKAEMFSTFSTWHTEH